MTEIHEVLEKSCVEHAQQSHPRGYGYKSRDGKVQLLHRLVYCDSHGLKIEDIKGVFIRHRCDNPRCIEPTHLIPGTHTDNMKDRDERGRTSRGKDVNGAKLTESDVFQIRAEFKKGMGRELGEKYGVHATTIRRIVRGVLWSHL
jgi:hypothetical protein